MSHHTAFMVGLAQFLDANDFGVYRESGVFSKAERGIVISAFPDAPPEVVSLTMYLPEFTRLSPTAERRMTASSVQIKYRLNGHPLEGLEYFDKLGETLDGKQLTLGLIRATCDFQSFTPLGPQNAAASWVFSSNWRFRALQAL